MAQSKERKIKVGLKCNECGHKFMRKVSSTDDSEVACPNCGSMDITLK